VGLPPQKPQGSPADRALGMDAEMARADFLDGRPFASHPSGQCAHDGPGGLGWLRRLWATTPLQTAIPML